MNVQNKIRFLKWLIGFVAAAFLLWFLHVDKAKIYKYDGLRIYSSEGRSLREFREEASGSYRQWNSLDQYPSFLIDALLTAEDHRFFWHPGFDPIATLRASYQNIQNGKILSGGSTITQQLARIVFRDELPKNRWMRKVAEIWYAGLLEWNFSKSEILEAYTNLVPLKYNRTGFASESKFLFGKSVRHLSRSEMLALVCLIRQSYSPRDLLKIRIQDLANRMDQPDLASEKEWIHLEASVYRANELYGKSRQLQAAPHFTEWIDANFSLLGGKLYSSIRYEWNQKIEKIIQNEINFLTEDHVKNAAVVVLELPQSKTKPVNKLVAMVGSENFFNKTDGQVNGATSIREAGSTLKPFLYGLAIEEFGLAPYSILVDENVSFHADDEGGTYRPRNYDLNYWGAMTLREALATSRNTLAVSLVDKIAPASFYQFLKEAGFHHLKESPSHYGPGIALGSGGTTLLELAIAYSVIANRGKLYPLYLGSLDNTKDVTFGKSSTLLQPDTTVFLTDILSDHSARKKAFGNRSFLDFPFFVAAKTGTSKDYRDSWTVGFTDRYLVAVWVGNFSGNKMNSVSGVWGAGRIFHQIIRMVTGAEKPHWRLPPDWKAHKFCKITGNLANADCPYRIEKTPASWKLPRKCSGIHEGLKTVSNRIQKSPHLTSPLDNQVFLLDPRIPMKNQAIPLRLSGNSNPKSRYWILLDGRQKLKIPMSGSLALRPSPGSHSIQLWEDQSHLQNITFSVKK